jgi:hypothetical protein
MKDLSENQRVKSNEAKREGLIREGIVEFLKKEGGISTRKETLDYLQDIVGLTNEEREARHPIPTAKRKSFYEIVVEFEAHALRKEKIIDEAEYDGIWILINCDITPREVKKIKTQAKNFYKGIDPHEISLACLARSKKEQKILRRVGSPIEKIRDYILQNHSSVEETIDYFIKQVG